MNVIQMQTLQTKSSYNQLTTQLQKSY